MVVDDEYDITFTLQAGLEDGDFGVDTFTGQNWHYLTSNLACMI